MVGQELAHPRNHLASVELDGRQPLFVRHSSSGVGQVESTEPEQPHHRGYFCCHGFRRSDIERPFGYFALESGHRRPGPSALERGLLERLLPARPLNVDRLLLCPRHVSVRVHAYRQWWVLVGFECALIELDQWRETAGRSADDGQHQGQPVASGADHRLWAATDTNPGGKVSNRESRGHVLVYERRSKLAGPGHGLGPEQPREQVELLLEELLVVGQVKPEQGEGLGQRATTDDELCAAVRYGVEGCKVRVDPHRG